MIARIWHGVTLQSKAEEYMNLLQETGIADYQGTEGNQGVHVLRRFEGNEAHFLIITFWDSIEAIQKFAGQDFEKARYYPEDKDYLLEFEETVTHYDVMFSAAKED
jgi:heme-degrading monooxygenase HmoA